MPVIAGNGAQELDAVKLAPRSGSAHAEYHRSCDRIIHNVQTGVSEYDDVFVRYLHHLAHQPSGLMDTGKFTVVTAVLALFRYER